MMCLVWISSGLSCLESAQLLQSIGLCFLPNLGSFQPLFLGVLFQPCPLSSLLLNSDVINIQSFESLDIVYYVMRFCILFKLFFFFDTALSGKRGSAA